MLTLEDKPNPSSASDLSEGVIRRNIVWLLVAFAYLWVFPYSPRINNPNENVRVYMTRALVEQHTLDIARTEAEWGWVNDKAKNGARLYSSKAPGASYLGVPVLATQTWLWHRFGWASPSKLAATLALRLFAVTLPLLAFYWAFMRHVRRVALSQPVADLLLVAVSLGSLMYPYGVHFVGHSLAAAASFAALMAIVPSDGAPPRARGAALCGMFAVAGVVLEYQNILVAMLLGLYVMWRHPRLLAAFVLGALPCAVLLGTFHTLCFGHPWDFPYGHLENIEFQTTGHSRGFYGLSLPDLRPLLGILFLPGFGLLICSPFLAVAILALGYIVARRPRAVGLLCGAVALALWVFLAGIPNWRGGWSVGPRYITAIVPFLVLPLAYAWPQGASRRFAPLAMVVTAGLVITGVFQNALWAVVYPQTPPQVRNPVFQIVLQLLRDGYAPYSVGYALGLRGPWSLLPVVGVIVGAVAIAVVAATWRRDQPLHGQRGTALALAVAAATLLPLALWPSQPTIAEQHALRVIKSTWDPPPVLLPPPQRDVAPPTGVTGSRNVPSK